MMKTEKEIVRAEANCNYTKIYFSDGTKKLVAKPLKQVVKTINDFEKLFIAEKEKFFHVHKKYFININDIRICKGKYAEMNDGSQIPISKKKRQCFLKQMQRKNLIVLQGTNPQNQ